MKSYIKYIGVFDKHNNCHHIDLVEGLNVITGRSSTGKSAIIEIFDFCTGNSDNTIPDGIITENALIYFIVIEVNETSLVLARKQEDKSTTAFYKIDPNFPLIEELRIEYFSDDYFVTLKTFKENLGRFWGIDISSKDENEIDIHTKSQKGRPSFRNMVSFILQHQNLIANKHSLFYRFDEKEKREKTIDEFKIFAGFVNQEYYILKQTLEEKKTELEKINKQLIQFEADKKEKVFDLECMIEEYRMITGKTLFPNISVSNLLNSPKIHLDQISSNKIQVDESSDEYRIIYKKLEQEKNQLIADKRKKSLELENVNTSIKNVQRYTRAIDDLSPVTKIINEDSCCPFCKHENIQIGDEINKLSDAIDWLNSELMKAPLMLDSFLPIQRKLTNEIKEIDRAIKEKVREQNKILSINKQLEDNKSLENQALKVLLQIENELDWSLKKNTNIIDLNINQIKKDIEILESRIRNNYNVEKKLEEAEIFINNSMNEIGHNLDFEDSYQPVNLHFDIKTFELYHLKNRLDENSSKKVYLRSMGSGANWLYSHICLFLSLLKYFSSLGNRALVPTILFLDQPSQVYFPSIIDIDEEKFDAKALKEVEGRLTEADTDLESVTKLFKEIIRFIDSVYLEYNIKPQIIISDHADNLKIEGDFFENYVRHRWRKKDEGFINKKLLVSKE